MVTQYPHTIVVEWTGEATQNIDLDWVPGSDQTFESECRAEVNSAGKKIAGVDGTLIEYAMTIYMPLTDNVIPVGAKYTLNGTTIGKVKGAWNGQLNSKLWV